MKAIDLITIILNYLIHNLQEMKENPAFSDLLENPDKHYTYLFTMIKNLFVFEKTDDGYDFKLDDVALETNREEMYDRVIEDGIYVYALNADTYEMYFKYFDDVDKAYEYFDSIEVLDVDEEVEAGKFYGKLIIFTKNKLIMNMDREFYMYSDKSIVNKKPIYFDSVPCEIMPKAQRELRNNSSFFEYNGLAWCVYKSDDGFYVKVQSFYDLSKKMWLKAEIKRIDDKKYKVLTLCKEENITELEKYKWLYYSEKNKDLILQPITNVNCFIYLLDKNTFEKDFNS